MAQFVRTALTLIILSLLVGLILATLGIHPSELPAALGSAISEAVRIIRRLIDWGW